MAVRGIEFSLLIFMALWLSFSLFHAFFLMKFQLGLPHFPLHLNDGAVAHFLNSVSFFFPPGFSACKGVHISGDIEGAFD